MTEDNVAWLWEYYAVVYGKQHDAHVKAYEDYQLQLSAW